MAPEGGMPAPRIVLPTGLVECIAWGLIEGNSFRNALEHCCLAAARVRSSTVGSLLPLFAAQGVKEYEPRVVNQLLDFVYRYVTDVLQDAEVGCALVLLKYIGHVLGRAMTTRNAVIWTPEPSIEHV